MHLCAGVGHRLPACVHGGLSAPTYSNLFRSTTYLAGAARHGPLIMPHLLLLLLLQTSSSLDITALRRLFYAVDFVGVRRWRVRGGEGIMAATGANYLPARCREVG